MVTDGVYNGMPSFLSNMNKDTTSHNGNDLYCMQVVTPRAHLLLFVRYVTIGSFYVLCSLLYLF